MQCMRSYKGRPVYSGAMGYGTSFILVVLVLYTLLHRDSSMRTTLDFRRPIPSTTLYNPYTEHRIYVSSVLPNRSPPDCPAIP